MNVAGIVFDHTALLALGSGSQLVSRLVVAAHGQAGRRVYAPALCLVAAIAQRPGLADHLGALPVIEVVDLGHAARPSAEWPQGLPVLTSVPEVYRPYGIALISL